MERNIQKAIGAHEEDSNFEEFRLKAAHWTQQAFELLSDKHSLYELLIKKLEPKKGNQSTSAAFRDFKCETKVYSNLRDTFAQYLASSVVPFGEMANVVRKMNPTRYFLFEVLKIEIKKLQAAGKVPAPYLEFQQGYFDIFEYLCASCYLLVPKVVHEIKTEKLTREDCLSQGYLGLVMAAHRFDFDKIDAKTGHPIKFTTFARLWIRERVFDAIEKNVFFLSVDSKTHDAYCRRNNGRSEDDNLALQGHNAAYPLQLEVSCADDSSLTDILDNSYAIGSPLKNPEEMVGEKDWAAAACELFRRYLTPQEYEIVYRKFEVLNGNDEQDNTTIEIETGIAQKNIPAVLYNALKKLRKNKRCLELITELRTSQSAPVAL